MTETAVSTLREVALDDWDAALDQWKWTDVYARRAFVQASAPLDGGTPLLLLLEADSGAIALPVLVRPIEGELRDVVTPYGYGGPIPLGEQPPTADEFGRAYDAWAQSSSIVSSFFRLHPLIDNGGFVDSWMRVDDLAGTVAIDTSPGTDIIAGLHGKHRNVVRKAERTGLTTTVTRGAAAIDGFVELYEQTMRRQQAADYYFFPPEYWETLRELGDVLVRFDAVLDGITYAQALCLTSAPWLHYHLGASSDEGRQAGASTYLLAQAALWAQEQQMTRLHLGGGVGGREDSLFAFKQRFAPGQVLRCQIARHVHLPDQYLRLSNMTALDTDGFFPAYRQQPT